MESNNDLELNPVGSIRKRFSVKIIQGFIKNSRLQSTNDLEF